MSSEVLESSRTLDVGIDGMTCGSCAARVQKTLGKQAGVSAADVNYATGRARLDVDGSVDIEDLRSAVERAGYSLDRSRTHRGASARIRRRGNDLWLVCGTNPEGAAAPGRRRRRRGQLCDRPRHGGARPRLDPRPAAPGRRRARRRLRPRRDRAERPPTGARPPPSEPTRPMPTRRNSASCGGDGPMISAPIAAFMVSTMLYHDLAMENEWMRWLQFALAIPVQFYVGWPILVGAAQRARHGTANMDTLIAMGTLSAFTFSTYQLFTGRHGAVLRGGRGDHVLHHPRPLPRGASEEPCRQGAPGTRRTRVPKKRG